MCTAFYTDKLLTRDDFRVVQNAVYKARRKWREIGSELGFTEDDLDNFADEGRTNQERLAVMLRSWLHKRSWHPSWDKLIQALRAKTVGREDVAHDIEQEYT